MDRTPGDSGRLDPTQADPTETRGKGYKEHPGLPIEPYKETPTTVSVFSRSS